MSSLPNSQPTTKYLTEIQVLSLDPLVKEAQEIWLNQHPEARTWPAAKLALLQISAETRWGRVQHGEEVYALNSRGQGPKTPLSETVMATLELYAQMPPSEHGVGWREQTPFTKVALDRDTVMAMQSMGSVAIADFIQRQLADYKEVVDEWTQLLTASRNRALRASARRARATEAPAPQQSDSIEIAPAPREGEGEGEGARVRV